jgi:orotidine-5'-phosphate decarboxylase
VNVSFSSKLAALRLQKSSVLCVGLDPDPSKMPAHLLADSTLSSAVVRFCTSIIEATETAAVAYKINFAFFEALGDSGMSALREVLHAIPEGSLTP